MNILTRFIIIILKFKNDIFILRNSLNNINPKIKNRKEDYNEKKYNDFQINGRYFKQSSEQRGICLSGN